MTRMMTLIAATALVLGALAVPVMADHNDRHSEAQADAAERRAAADEARNASLDARDDRRAEAQERRDAMRDSIAERREAFREAREACLDAFRERNSTENGTLAPGRCISMAAHDIVAKQGRALHHAEHMIDALERRLAVLQQHEDRVQAAIDSGDLNETELAAAEARLERIDAAQEKLEAQLQAIRDRIAAASDETEGDGEPDAEEESDEESDDESEDESEEDGE